MTTLANAAITLGFVVALLFAGGLVGVCLGWAS